MTPCDRLQRVSTDGHPPPAAAEDSIINVCIHTNVNNDLVTSKVRGVS